MNRESVIEEVARIARCRGDAEAAHGMEDALRAEFIEFIANSGHPDFAPIAQEILMTDGIDFERWCA